MTFFGELTSKLTEAFAKSDSSKSDSSKKEEPHKKKLKHPTKLFYETRLDSFGSLSSIYSADGGQPGYRISGSVLLGIWYKNETLYIRVVTARHLAGAKAGGRSDPYVKTYLLPDASKLTKRKTTIDRKTNNPTYNETLKTKLSQADVEQSTLWVSIWDWDRFGKNLFLGEVRLPLAAMDLTNSTDRWYKLKDKSCEPTNQECGSIVFSILFSPYSDEHHANLLDTGHKKGSLFIKIHESKGLPAMNQQGSADSAVRIFLLPSRSTYTKKKSKCIKNSINPAWNEEFEYKYLSIEELKANHALELTVWDYDRRGCNDFIGCVRIGPAPDETNSMHKDWMDSTESEAEHWAKMLTYPGQWVKQEHKLRPSIASQFAEQPKYRNDTEYEFEYSDNSDDDDDDSIYGSNTSLYSECETRGDYPITGSLKLKLEYKKNHLLVHILSATDLAAADLNGYSDPYVKLYLLPDKSKRSKRKTSVKMSTLNPIFNETMQYEVEEANLSSRTLWFSVWDWDRFGKNEFLGEVRVPLTEAKLDGQSQLYGLSDNSNVGVAQSSTSPVGTLTMGLKFEKLGITNGETYGKLHVHIRCAENLLNMDDEDYTDGFIMMFLLPNKSSKSKRKTQVVKNNLSPTWNEWFLYNRVSLEQLSTSHTLEVAVWDHDFLSSNDFVGGIRIGPVPKPGVTKEWMDSNAMEFSHWEEMLSRPGEWVERCHTLRPSMEYRTVSIPDVPPSVPLSEKEDSVGSGSPIPSTQDSGTTEKGDSVEEKYSDSPAVSISNVPVVSKQAASVEEEKPVPRLTISESAPPADVNNKAGSSKPLEDTPDSKGNTAPSIHSVEGEERRPEEQLMLSITEPTITSDGSTSPKHMHRGSFDLSKGTLSPIHPRWKKRATSEGAVLVAPGVLESGDHDVGRLVVSLKFEVSSKKYKTKGMFHVKIKQAQQLRCDTTNGIFARCCMLPQRAFSSTKSTKMIKDSENPVWDESYSFGKHVLDEIAADRALQVTLWFMNSQAKPIFVGGLRLGPKFKTAAKKFSWMDSIDKEVEHWESVFENPGEWVDVEHALRAAMNC